MVDEFSSSHRTVYQEVEGEEREEVLKTGGSVGRSRNFSDRKSVRQGQPAQERGRDGLFEAVETLQRGSVMEKTPPSNKETDTNLQ